MAGCGLFGKIRDRGDFIALDVPRPFLALWEPWLQQGLFASRQALGTQWQAAYLTAPIWHFRLGASLCGGETVGAFMPSIDGAGRCFPLTLVACCPPGSTFTQGEDDEPGWFVAADDLLLATLSDDATFETVRTALGRLAPPAAFGAGLAVARDTSRWWTHGGEVFGPMSFTSASLPDPAVLTTMLAGGRTASHALSLEARHGG